MQCYTTHGKFIDEMEYSVLVGEIDLMRERVQKLKGQHTERAFYLKRSFIP